MGTFVGNLTRKSLYILILLVFSSLLACLPNDVKEGDTEVDVIPDVGGDIPPDDSPAPDALKAICDPLIGQGVTFPDRGLVGNLFYLPPDNSQYYTTLDSYFTLGTKVDATLYFNRINVPTRPFDRGFETRAGETITNQNGTTLYEYFALDLYSVLKLSDRDEPGYYQFSILSDDGSTIKLDRGNGYEMYINNDGTHATKMGCSTEAIYMDANTRIPAKIQYYQGPRFHIAFMIMMKKVTAANAALDVRCGQSGNSKFFDSTVNPPAPQQAFIDLLDRQWKILEGGNWQLPAGTNPCTNIPTEGALEITQVKFAPVSNTSELITWTTSIPADSLVTYKDLVTNVTRTASVAGNVTSHSVTLTGLTSNRQYMMTVTSTSPGGQVVTSDAVVFRTTR